MHACRLLAYHNAKKILDSDGMLDIDLGNSELRRKMLADARVAVSLNTANCLLNKADLPVEEGRPGAHRDSMF